MDQLRGEGRFVKVKIFGYLRTLHAGSGILISPKGILVTPPPLDERHPGAPVIAQEFDPAGRVYTHDFNHHQ
jgi:hypothetical protein